MGTIQLVHIPAQLDVVDKKLQPPSVVAEFKKREDVSEHQLSFLESSLQSGRDAMLKELAFFGDKIGEQINGPGFEWKGLGTITRSTQSLPLALPSLQPVTAQKVWRTDAQHAVLVGDKEMTSVEMNERRSSVDVVEKKSSIYVVAGWILLGLCILVIAFFLYTGKFKVSAAGSRLKPVSFQSLQTTQKS